MSPATSSLGTSSTTAIRQGSTTQVGGYSRDIVARNTNRAWATSRQSRATSATKGQHGTTGTSGTSATGSRKGSKGSSSRRRALGGGLVNLPPMPTDEPMKRVMVNARIPDKKAHCPNCDAQVNPDKKYCSNCGSNYNFKPTLKAGDVVANQYEVKGAMAFGGMGWMGCP
jgi:serine/threonine-protein kinase PknG